jgi:hypothetical protein
MEKLVLVEQDIVNAICVYTARKERVQPEEVEVDLIYDDESGFSAETYTLGRTQVLDTSSMIEALRLWIDEYLKRDPFSGIKLELDEEAGIIAYVG